MSEIDDIIDEVMVNTRNKQMTREEYEYIASLLGDKKFLVFGTGFDSDLWRHANKDGMTLFLENNAEWIKNHDDTLEVKYTTTLVDAPRLLGSYNKGDTSELEMDLPQVVYETDWDYIFVDSPEGWNPTTPGRMQSIYAASKLPGEVLVHDCDRYCEDRYSNAMLGTKVKELTKLRHYNNTK